MFFKVNHSFWSIVKYCILCLSIFLVWVLGKVILGKGALSLFIPLFVILLVNWCVSTAGYTINDKRKTITTHFGPFRLNSSLENIKKVRQATEGVKIEYEDSFKWRNFSYSSGNREFTFFLSLQDSESFFEQLKKCCPNADTN